MEHELADYIKELTEVYKGRYNPTPVTIGEVKETVVSAKKKCFKLPHITKVEPVEHTHEYYLRVFIKEELLTKNNIRSIVDQMIQTMDAYMRDDWYDLVDFTFCDYNGEVLRLSETEGGRELRLSVKFIKE